MVGILLLVSLAMAFIGVFVSKVIMVIGIFSILVLVPAGVYAHMSRHREER
jgi:hypothetical protein